MRTTFFGAAAVAALVAATPASATTTIYLHTVGDTMLGAFGNLDPAGRNTDTYTFTLPKAGTVDAGVVSFGFRLFGTNLDFTSVTLNGQDFQIDSTGILEERSLSAPVQAGLQTLKVGYRNAQAFSSYAGAIRFTPTALPPVVVTPGAVPEPASWALMIGGIGLVGAAMRRRKANVRTTVAFA